MFTDILEIISLPLVILGYWLWYRVGFFRGRRYQIFSGVKKYENGDCVKIDYGGRVITATILSIKRKTQMGFVYNAQVIVHGPQRIFIHSDEILGEYNKGKFKIESEEEEKVITAPVCDKCLKASCLQGIAICCERRDGKAGVITRTIWELKQLSLEDPDYWTMESKKMKSVRCVCNQRGLMFRMSVKEAQGILKKEGYDIGAILYLTFCIKCPRCYGETETEGE